MSKPSNPNPAKSENKSLREENVEGLEKFNKRIKELEGEKPPGGIIVFFTGSNDSTGVSWCPDCQKVEALMPELKKKFRPGSVLLRVKVGQMVEWKMPENPFRTDKRLKLTGIPVIMIWNTPKKLGPGPQVKDLALLSLLFEDD